MTSHSNRKRTSAATQKAKLKSEIKARKLRGNICKVFAKRCGHDTCVCATGDFSNLCFSAKGLAKILNIEKIETIRGKVGRWQTTQVKRLFPTSNFSPEGSETPQSSKPSNATNSFEGYF